MSRSGVPDKSLLSKDEIRRMAEYMTGVEIARVAGVSRQRIGQIVSMREIKTHVVEKQKIAWRFRRVPIRHIAEVYLWENIDIRNPDECWNWKAGLGPHGYGAVRLGKKNIHWGRFHGNGYACRLAYLSIYGKLPGGKKIKHTCGNRLCCNPRHLIA